MAKAFTADEKTAILERLKNEAVRCLTETGIRKTTVEELCAAAGISKGAFYLFFPSKEVLFFAVIQDWHEKAEDVMLSGLSAQLDAGPEALTGILLKTFRFVESSFFPKLVAGGELEMLMR
jgi:AcrR family transcriptional regulator